MTNEEKLTNIKLQLNIEDNSLDDKLNAYLDMAEKEIIAWLYTNVKQPDGATVPTKYDVTHVQAVVVAFTVEGAEGEEIHHENGINRKFNYDTMIAYIRSHVYPYAGV